jgi:hypothetical protein
MRYTRRRVVEVLEALQFRLNRNNPHIILSLTNRTTEAGRLEYKLTVQEGSPHYWMETAWKNPKEMASYLRGWIDALDFVI